jgi:hypothetical protein
MLNGTITALTAALVLVTALYSPARLEAADRFAVVSIVNETTATITLTYRWGNDEKKRRTFAPGARHWFSYEYTRANANRSPDFFVTFDADTTKGKYSEEKKLHGFRAPEQNYDLGHKYVFRYDGPAKRFIELYDASR